MTGFAPDITLPWDLRFGQADGPDQVRQRVRELVSQGADVIKVLASGAVLTHNSNPGASEFTPERQAADGENNDGAAGNAAGEAVSAELSAP